MILVVEGISASGKTTWCTWHGGQHVIAEHGRLEDVPERASDPVAAAVFWAERNVDRWQAALAMEASTSWAVCDSDPLKLHYLWCLWQIGEASTNDWLTELDATRDTVAQGALTGKLYKTLPTPLYHRQMTTCYCSGSNHGRKKTWTWPKYPSAAGGGRTVNYATCTVHGCRRFTEQLCMRFAAIPVLFAAT